MHTITQCSVPIVLFGITAMTSYCHYLTERRIRFSEIPYPKDATRWPGPMAFLEFSSTPEGRQEFWRMVIEVPHPEQFLRHRGYEFGATQRLMTIQERLIEWDAVIFYVKSHLPEFLSTMKHFYIRRKGVVVSMDVFQNFDPNLKFRKLSTEMMTPAPFFAK
jgi:hypothetical protein